MGGWAQVVLAFLPIGKCTEMVIMYEVWRFVHVDALRINGIPTPHLGIFPTLSSFFLRAS